MTQATPAFHRHDHSHCAENVMERADALAQTRGLRLTPVRRRVLEILLEEHRAMGAYDVLERLHSDGFGSQPPVAYRALDFLVEHGLAHRIRRLNAFMACMTPGHSDAAVFLICDECDAVAELPAARTVAAMRAESEAEGFRIRRMSLEASGICPSCHRNAHASD